MKKKNLKKSLDVAVNLISEIIFGSEKAETEAASKALALEEARHFLVATDKERAKWGKHLWDNYWSKRKAEICERDVSEGKLK